MPTISFDFLIETHFVFIDPRHSEELRSTFIEASCIFKILLFNACSLVPAMIVGRALVPTLVET